MPSGRGSQDSDRTNVAIVQRSAVKTPRALRRYLSLDDFERAARRHLPRALFGYVSGGVEDDHSLRDNLRAYDAWRFVPRILRDTSARSTRLSLFGESFEVPFAIAPMGFSALAAYDGDVALAQGAQAAGSFAICSAASLTPLERVAGEAQSRWFQAYVPGDDARIEGLVTRVAQAGFETLVITGDVPVAGNRENNARNGFDAPFRLSADLIWQGITHPGWTIGTLGREMMARGMPHFENMEAVQGPPLFSRTLLRSTIARDRLNWDSIALIRRLWPGKLVIKGILCAEDAVIAFDHGADGVILSNHGGRQIDGAVAAFTVLPEVRARCPEGVIMMDGGIRRGADVLKALALGADFTFVGRPFLYAAAMAGQAGVTHAAQLLRDEVARNMAMLGITQLGELSREHLRPADAR